jgi:hypothetical protein
MSDFLPDPPRWKDVPSHATATERSAAMVARLLASPAPLTQVELARIRGRISAPRAAFPLRFWLTVTGALLLGGATAASAARLHLLPGWLTGATHPASAPAEPGKSTSSLRSHRPAAPTGTLESFPSPADPSDVVATATKPAARPPEPQFAPDPGPSGAAAPLRPRRGRTVASAEPPAPSQLSARTPVAAVPSVGMPATPAPTPESLPPAMESPSPLPTPYVAPTRRTAPERSLGEPWLSDSSRSQEAKDTSARLLSEAIRTLRAGHAADRALAFLDAHDAELLRGGFGHEALLVRVEALLALQRSAEALGLLDATSLGNVAASKSLRLTRAGLRAAAGRCAEAIADYESVLAAAGRPDERALRGRDACRRELTRAQPPLSP